jgi:hypothetical protein
MTRSNSASWQLQRRADEEGARSVQKYVSTPDEACADVAAAKWSSVARYGFVVSISVATAGCGDGYLDSLYSLSDPNVNALEEGGVPNTSDASSADSGTDAGVLPPEGLLIDDMEDGDAFIAQVGGRQGAWYLYNDGSSGDQWPVPVNMTPVTDREGASSYALRFGASGFTGWGSGIATPLADFSPYDVSRFIGISFWARVEEGSKQGIRVNLPTLQTTPAGGACYGSGEYRCYDYFGTDLTLSTEWALYTVYFRDITQIGWGYKPPDGFDAPSLQEINFFPGEAHDVWIDDVVFLAP